MTLADTIAADVDSVFLNEDEFGQLVTIYPGGDPISAVQIYAIEIWDDLEGTRESHGDGVTLNRDVGKAVRQSVKLEVAATADIDDKRRPVDLVKMADDTMFALKRILGVDRGMKTCLYLRRDDISLRRPVKSG